MGVFYGLSAALCWGVADFFATNVSRRIGALRALWWTQSVSLLAVLVILSVRGELAIGDGAAWAVGIGLGTIHFAATIALYHAFEVGTLSIVSPIASSYVILTALLARASGERTSPWALAGAALLLVGIVLLARSEDESAQVETVRDVRRGLWAAAVAATGFGIVFWGLDRLTAQTSALWPLLPLRICNVIGAMIVGLVARRKENAPHIGGATRKIIGGVILVAACDTLAWLGFTMGLESAQTTIVTALSSLFAAFTIALATLFLGERLSKIQWAGVAIILLGVALVGFAPAGDSPRTSQIPYLSPSKYRRDASAVL